MSPSRLLSFPLLLVLALAAAGCGRHMTPQQFRELVATPGDDVPLVALITNGSPHWPRSTASMSIKFADGKFYSEELPITSKTIAGKYIVYSTQSKFYRQEMHSILAADEASGKLTVYSLYGDTLISADVVCNPRTKTYTENASYGEGFVEFTKGQYSDIEDISHTDIYQHGRPYMQRDATNRPVTLPAGK